MDAAGNAAGTGSSSAPVSVSEGAIAKDAAMSDEELMREALKALEPAVDLLRTEARKHHDNLEPVQELRALKVLNPARAAIAKLEQRLLKE